MRWELILGGVVLLGCAYPLKVFFEKGTFQRLTLAFTFVWAAFAAMHFWAFARGLLASYLPLDSPGLLDVAAFWFAYLFGCLPGALLIRWGLCGYETTFPVMIDRVLSWGLSALLVVVLICLMLMSLALHSDATRASLWGSDTFGPPCTMVSRLPLNIYFRVAPAVSASTPAVLGRYRVPQTALRSLRFIRENGGRNRRNAS